jgi:cytidine deaminase
MSQNRLVEAALNVRKLAYVPHSKFAVGAALLSKSGNMFVRYNIENVPLRLTMCAEQGAVAAAVANGDRGFIAVAVVADSSEPIAPCGVCRQVLAEFNPAVEVITPIVDGRTQTFSLSEVLPRPTQRILKGFRNV